MRKSVNSHPSSFPLLFLISKNTKNEETAFLRHHHNQAVPRSRYLSYSKNSMQNVTWCQQPANLSKQLCYFYYIQHSSDDRYIWKKISSHCCWKKDSVSFFYIHTNRPVLYMQTAHCFIIVIITPFDLLLKLFRNLYSEREATILN